jgi:hypothetical protein
MSSFKPAIARRGCAGEHLAYRRSVLEHGKLGLFHTVTRPPLSSSPPSLGPSPLSLGPEGYFTSPKPYFPSSRGATSRAQSPTSLGQGGYFTSPKPYFTRAGGGYFTSPHGVVDSRSAYEVTPCGPPPAPAHRPRPGSAAPPLRSPGTHRAGPRRTASSPPSSPARGTRTGCPPRSGGAAAR